MRLDPRIKKALDEASTGSGKCSSCKGTVYGGDHRPIDECDEERPDKSGEQRPSLCPASKLMSA